MLSLPLACLFVVGVQSVTELPDPRPAGWVVDQANVIDPADEAALATTLGAIHDGRGAQVVVVTVDDVPDSPKAFATALFNHWQLGTSTRDDGVLVLLVVGQRRLEIETGIGLENALPPWWLTELQQQEMVPHFKSGALGAGLVAGAHGLRVRLENLPGEAERATVPGGYEDNGAEGAAPGAPAAGGKGPAPSAPPPASGDGGPSTTLLVLGGLGALGAGGGAIALGLRRRKRRRCACGEGMLPLDEVADDAYLSDGQRAEERVGSMDYEVLICPGCQASRTLAHRRWFSGREKCSACSFKTQRSTSHTVVRATYDHGGKVEVTEECAHCKRRKVWTRTTARRTRPTTTSSSSSSRSSYSSSSSSRSSYSSSSSSRSSSSSGGRSRGGGAGSSW